MKRKNKAYLSDQTRTSDLLGEKLTERVLFVQEFFDRFVTSTQADEWVAYIEDFQQDLLNIATNHYTKFRPSMTQQGKPKPRGSRSTLFFAQVFPAVNKSIVYYQ